MYLLSAKFVLIFVLRFSLPEDPKQRTSVVNNWQTRFFGRVSDKTKLVLICYVQDVPFRFFLKLTLYQRSRGIHRELVACTFDRFRFSTLSFYCYRWVD